MSLLGHTHDDDNRWQVFVDGEEMTAMNMGGFRLLLISGMVCRSSAFRMALR